jgi:hypothetical protein
MAGTQLEDEFRSNELEDAKQCMEDDRDAQ